MIGEIGGPDEAEAAQWCKANMKKPIVGFIAGVTAPPGKRMGHAGALISGGADTADAKLAIMEEWGFVITRNPSELGKPAQGPAEVIQRFQASPWVGLPRTVDCTRHRLVAGAFFCCSGRPGCSDKLERWV